MSGSNPGPNIPTSSASFTPAPSWAQNNVPANAQNTASIIGGSIQDQNNLNSNSQSQSNSGSNSNYTGTVLGG